MLGRVVPVIDAERAWYQAASRAIMLVAKREAVMTADDVWRAIPAGLTTHDPRALGALMRAAKKAGIITPTKRWAESTRRVCHRRPMRVWRSLIRR
jgi:hypothetical protein